MASRGRERRQLAHDGAHGGRPLARRAGDARQGRVQRRVVVGERLAAPGRRRLPAGQHQAVAARRRPGRGCASRLAIWSMKWWVHSLPANGLVALLSASRTAACPGDEIAVLAACSGRSSSRSVATSGRTDGRPRRRGEGAGRTTARCVAQARNGIHRGVFGLEDKRLAEGGPGWKCSPRSCIAVGFATRFTAATGHRARRGNFSRESPVPGGWRAWPAPLESIRLSRQPVRSAGSKGLNQLEVPLHRRHARRPCGRRSSRFGSAMACETRLEVMFSSVAEVRRSALALGEPAVVEHLSGTSNMSGCAFSTSSSSTTE